MLSPLPVYADGRIYMKNVKETVMHGVFLIAACVSILAVALICIFLFVNGLPAIAKIGPIKFLTGIKWKPMNEIFGIFPMIVGSIYVTAGAISHSCGSSHRNPVCGIYGKILSEKNISDPETGH